jgi:hypothetical protein
MRRSFRLPCVLPLVVILAACAEPPSKEMNQAQGALDAASAAGAEQYAPGEFAAAAAALKQSEEAVLLNDYRLALSLAIDSRSRAEAAAKVAVENRAKARGDAERVVAEANALLTQARARLSEPTVSKLPRRPLAQARDALNAEEKTLQEARAAVGGNDYRRAMELAGAASERIQATLAAIDQAAAPPPARKRR